MTSKTLARIALDLHRNQRELLSSDDIYWKGTHTRSITAFRGRTDTVTLNSTTWTYAENTPFFVALNTNFRLRLLRQETAGVAAGGTTNLNSIFFTKNGGTLTQALSGTEEVVRVLSSQYANGDTMNEQLTGGTGTLITAIGVEGTSLSNIADFTANNRVETEFTLQLSSANGAVNGDVFVFYDFSGVGTVTAQVTAGTGATFAASQTAYRFAEDGTESGATLIGTLNTALSRDVTSDSNLQLRIRIQETGGAAGAATDDYQLQRSINGGAFADVTTTSTGAKVNTGSALTDGGATTNRLGAGSGSFVAGEQEEGNGLVEDIQLTASNFTEHVWALTLVAADLVNTDQLTFRVLRNGSTMTYSQTPTINVTKTAVTSLIFPVRTPAMSSLLVR